LAHGEINKEYPVDFIREGYYNKNLRIVDAEKILIYEFDKEARCGGIAKKYRLGGFG